MAAKAVERTAADELRNQMTKVGEDISELGSAAKEAAQEKVDHVRSAMTDYYKQGKAKAQELEHSLEDKIRTHPIQAVLVAAGVGLVIGLLLRRR